MTIIHAFLLGIVEGVTEFLPISSTGHLIIAGKLLNLPGGEFEKSFDIIIQLGAILAVIVQYFRFWWGGQNHKLWQKLLIAFLPTGVLGLVFHGFIKNYLLGNHLVVIAALFLGGVFILWFESRVKSGLSDEAITQISYRQAFLIGVAQSLAMIPGVSRSAATIIGGLQMGINRKTIVEFSFLLAVPTMIAATGFDLWQSYQGFSANNFWLLLVGFLTAFGTAWFVIKWLLSYIVKHDFRIFGWYRIVVSIIFYLLIVF